MLEARASQEHQVTSTPSRYEVLEVLDREPAYLLHAPDGTVVGPVRDYFLDLVASDCSPATVKSYAYALLDWFRFLHAASIQWDEARREHVRDYVLHLRAADNPYRHPHLAAAPAPGTRNPRTGKPSLGPGYKPATINHRLSVVKSYYAYHRMRGAGPPLNPVPEPRPGEHANAHHTPDDPWVPSRRAPYRQKQPELLPRAITDDLWEQVFGCLTSHRDRAILCLLVSSGCRAGELLQMTRGDVDWGRQSVRLITKGTRVPQWVAASPDFFRWLARYLAERGSGATDQPLWWTLRKPVVPLTYQALRKILVRVNATLGTNLVLHDLRHTCALRLASDPSVPITHVQAHLRHKHLTTTELYLRARPEDVIASVQAHHHASSAQQAPAPSVAPRPTWQYDPADLHILLGEREEEA